MSLEKTLVILKPSTVQRGLIGEITHRFERKGLRLAGMKMMQLTEDLETVLFSCKSIHDGLPGYRMLL